MFDSCLLKPAYSVNRNREKLDVKSAKELSGDWDRLSPEYCVFTNKSNGPDPRILWRIERIANSTVLITGKENGVIAEIGDNGSINFYNSIY